MNAPVNEKGGQFEHVQTVAEMAAHTHHPDGWVAVMSPGGNTGSLGNSGTKLGSYRDFSSKQNYATSSTGSSVAMKMMPPYYATYIWHRTA